MPPKRRTRRNGTRNRTAASVARREQCRSMPATAGGSSSNSRSRIRTSSPRRGRPSPHTGGAACRGWNKSAPRTSANITQTRTPIFRRPTNRTFDGAAMMKLASRARLLAGGILSGLAVASLGADAAAQNTPPDFMNGNAWLLNGAEFKAVQGETVKPVSQDPRYRYVPNNTNEQPTYRIGDISNPNLKPWVAEAMKKDNDEVLAGKYAYTARSSCAPGGVPGFMTFPAQPIYFIQTPNKVLMLYQGNAEVRHIHMNVQHTRNPKPSFYGESVGRYEGDTLVIDT